MVIDSGSFGPEQVFCGTLVTMGNSSTGRIVVAEAPDAVTAAIWVDALRDAGLDATTFSRGHGAAFGGAEAFSTYPVLVAETSITAARAVIVELDGSSKLAPIPDREADARRLRGALLAVGAIIAALIAAALLGRLLG